MALPRPSGRLSPPPPASASGVRGPGPRGPHPSLCALRPSPSAFRPAPPHLPSLAPIFSAPPSLLHHHPHPFITSSLSSPLSSLPHLHLLILISGLLSPSCLGCPVTSLSLSFHPLSSSPPVSPSSPSPFLPLISPSGSPPPLPNPHLCIAGLASLHPVIFLSLAPHNHHPISVPSVISASEMSHLFSFTSAYQSLFHLCPSSNLPFFSSLLSFHHHLPNISTLLSTPPHRWPASTSDLQHFSPL